MLYVISSHILYTKDKKENYGPANCIFDYLKKAKKKTVFIKHCLEGKNNTFIEDNKGTVSEIKGNKNFLLLRNLSESFCNIKTVLAYKRKYKNEKIIYIGIDPVNAVSGAILKLFGIIDKNIYFTVDYADRRFKNWIFNFTYHLTDKVGLVLADEDWCVSSRIMEKRKQQGVEENKIKLLPNSPDLKIPLVTNKSGINLIIVAHLTKSLDLMPVLRIISDLSEVNKSIKLNIVGTGPEERAFKQIVKNMKLNSRVKFTGQKSHKDTIKIIAESFLGFALYSDENPWNKYGDSMKAREYLAAGVPVIINNVPSTADDVKKNNAGIVAESSDYLRITEFIDKCITDKNYYKTLVNNALRMADIYDKNRILNKLLDYGEKPDRD